MRDIEELREAIRQFERYQESGWSKSEVPNSACLIRALDALRDNNQLRAENERLKAVVEAAKRCIKAERDGVMTNEYYREYKAALKAYEGVKGR